MVSALETGLSTSRLILRKNSSQGACMDYRLRRRPLTPTFLYCWGPLQRVVPHFLSSIYYCYLVKPLNSKENMEQKKHVKLSQGRKGEPEMSRSLVASEA